MNNPINPPFFAVFLNSSVTLMEPEVAIVIHLPLTIEAE